MKQQDLARVRELKQRLERATNPTEIEELTKALIATQIQEGPRSAKDIVARIEAVIILIRKEGKEEFEPWIEQLGSVIHGVQLLADDRRKALVDRAECEKGMRHAITDINAGRTNRGVSTLMRLAWTTQEQREAYSVKSCVMCKATSADPTADVIKVGKTWLCARCRSGEKE